MYMYISRLGATWRDNYRQVVLGTLVYTKTRSWRAFDLVTPGSPSSFWTIRLKGLFARQTCDLA